MPNLKLESSGNDLANRLCALMKEKGFNISTLAKKTGIALGTIQKMLTNSKSNPTYSTLKAVSEALNISIGTLLNEKDILNNSDKRIQVITWEQVIDFINKPQTNVQVNIDSFVVSNLALHNQAFALKFVGNDTTPLFKENTILIFDPNKKPYNRSYVLIKYHNHEIPSLKQLIIEEPLYYIKSVNPEFAHEKIKLLSSKDKIIATLVQSLFNY